MQQGHVFFSHVFAGEKGKPTLVRRDIKFSFGLSAQDTICLQSKNHPEQTITLHIDEGNAAILATLLLGAMKDMRKETMTDHDKVKLIEGMASAIGLT